MPPRATLLLLSLLAGSPALGLALAAAPALAQAPSAAAPTPAALDAARRSAEAHREAAEAAGRAATAAAAEEHRLAERRVALAREAQAAERRVAEAEARARAAAAAATAAREEAATLASALAPVLPLIHRLSLWPAETLLAAPVPPEEALRGLLVLQGVTHDVARQAAALREASRRARDRLRAAETERHALSAAEAAAETAAAALESDLQVARRHRAATADAASAASQRAAESVARAATLRDALERFEREQARREAAEAKARARAEAAAARARGRGDAEPRPAAAPPAPVQASGGRALPVAGTLLRGFGAAGDDGPSRGLTWQAAPGARVVSPCGGRVAFAAPFRSYGQLVIVDCGAQQHFVLAGLGRVDVQPGQRILAGEPVGQLGAAGQGRATLYGELRRGGQAVDPGPWLRGG